ncbi:MAG: helix-turn-helix domain-containing protein [Chromatiaceae bacterium]
MIDELRSAALLSRLSAEQLQRVTRHALRMRLEEGQWLFSQGDAAERFYLLRSGQIKLFRLSSDGGEKVIDTATSRLARYLLIKLPSHRRALELDVRKGVLASRLSIKPETFSRAVKQLADQGVIEVHGSHFTVLDRRALAELADLASAAELGPVLCPPDAPTAAEDED